MKYSLKILLIPALVAGLFMLAACSSNSGNNNSNAAGNGNVSATKISSQSSGGGSQPSSSGKTLSDCDYATQFGKAFASLAGADASAAAASKDQVQASIDSANQALKNLKGITPPPAYAQFHADFVSAFQTAVDQMTAAKKSLDAGDAATAESTIVKAEQSFSDQADLLQTKYATVTSRLDACPVPTP